MAKSDSAKADHHSISSLRSVIPPVLALVATLGSASAFAQPPPTPFDPPAQPPPDQPPPQPPPPIDAPPPAGPPPEGGPPPPAGPPPGGPPPGGTFGGEVGGQVGFGPPPGPPAGADVKPEEDEEARARTLAEQISITGSTGLFRTAYAGSSEGGMFRVAAMFDWFTGGFLCDAEHPCGAPGTRGSETEDGASHVGAFFALNATPISFLEAYAAIRTYANSNDQGSPALLQVLGDTTFGVKAFTPFRIGEVMTFGGDIRLKLLNAAGDVGVSGGGTSADFFVVTSADLRKIRGKGVGAPVRFHLNLGYMIDNSGELVEDVEILRAERDPDTAGGLERIAISRIERFGLGINRVDFFGIRFGIDVPIDRIVQPYAEWTLEIPVNRQGYECHTRTISPGDECLALIRDENGRFSDPNLGGPGFAAIPSRVTLGIRTNPLPGLFRGLSGHVAFDIGTSGMNSFIEEVAPQAPWTLWFGLGYAFDTKEKVVKAPVTQPPPQPLPPAPLPPEYYVRGLVVAKGTTNAVPNAVVTVEGSPEPPVATDVQGRFITRKLAPGTYTLRITAPDHNPGTCSATIVPAEQPQPNFPGGPPGAPGAPPGAPPGGPMGPPPPAPSGPIYTDVQCEIEPAPKAGGVQGSTQSAEGGAALANVTVELIDVNGTVHTTKSGPDGSFGFKDLPLGDAKIKGTHDEFMVHVQQTTVRPREDVKVVLTLNPRPKVKTVRIVGNQLQVLKKIHFELNSAVIKGDSFQLMEEIADVLQRNPDLKKVEVQGHTDNTGTPEINNKLSQDRADSVRTWLVDHGIAGDRLIAKGYGATRPLAPNVTPANRERNRRVQFVILEREKAAPGGLPKPPGQ